MKKVVGIVLTIIGIVVVALGVIFKVKGQMSLSIIGGADGPTSIFVAGQLGSVPAALGIIAGVVLFAVGIFMIIRKK